MRVCCGLVCLYYVFVFVISCMRCVESNTRYCAHQLLTPVRLSMSCGLVANCISHYINISVFVYLYMCWCNTRYCVLSSDTYTCPSVRVLVWLQTVFPSINISVFVYSYLCLCLCNARYCERSSATYTCPSVHVLRFGCSLFSTTLHFTSNRYKSYTFVGICTFVELWFGCSLFSTILCFTLNKCNALYTFVHLYTCHH